MPRPVKQKWKFDPQLKFNPTFQHITCRGVSYHETTPAAEVQPQRTAQPLLLCARRIILPVNDGRLFALDADSGKHVAPAFGNNGELNLQSNMPYADAGPL
jgi:quinoprotein glucose dehydrogenase